jgi:predicted ATPase/transcriptional regulator with XRE-family HTH domain
MSHSQSVAALLRHHRVAAGLSQEALSERAGLSVRGLSDLERGRSRAPRLDTLNRLSDALGLDAAQRFALVEASGHLGPADAQDEPAEQPPPAADPPDAARPAGGAVTAPARLPVYLTQLIGREADVDEIACLLTVPTTRLVTLTGPGGVGKTRLAVQVASNLADTYPDGAAFVELASIADPDLVVSLIAQTLGVAERRDQTLFDLVVAALRDARCLLVLDNFEHVLSAAGVVADLLRETRGVDILVTSRTLLRLNGEQVFSVPPLPLPTGTDGNTVESAARWPAITLFVLRAQAVQPSFEVTADNVASVLGVCRALDGLPLALELAAARVNVLPPATLLERLQRRLAVLTSGKRDAPDRHRALRSAIAWSYDLLGPDEQRLFRWLGVFAGGFTLGTAEALCGSPVGPDGTATSVLDGLGALVEHSLVQAQPTATDARFRLLETIREHALERLAAAGEAGLARRQHASVFLDLAESAERHLLGPRRGVWLQRLDADFDNIRAALAWCISAEGNDVETGQRLVGSLAWFWYLRGHLHEGSRWATQAVALTTEDVPEFAQARGLMAVGGTVVMLGDAQTARPHLERSTALYRKVGDWRLSAGLALLGLAQTSLGEPALALESYAEGVAHARAMGDVWIEAYMLTNLGGAWVRLGETANADELYSASLRLFTDLGDVWGRAIALRGMANLAALQKNYASARELFEAATQSFRDTGDTRGLAQTLIGMGKTAMRLGLTDDAAEIFREALQCWRDVGIWAGVVRCLTALGWVAATQGRLERSTRLYAAASPNATALRVVFPPADVAAIDRTLQFLRSELGDERFRSIWSSGAALSLAQAAEVGLASEASAAG